IISVKGQMNRFYRGRFLAGGEQQQQHKGHQENQEKLHCLEALFGNKRAPCNEGTMIPIHMMIPIRTMSPIRGIMSFAGWRNGRCAPVIMPDDYGMSVTVM